ncbi:MAG: alpha-2-macroglobulin, partial [Deltaproteobacteria bacterium]|nr:alpha-2-macroglobulin [Deltaproteobacteria bacterium]
LVPQLPGLHVLDLTASDAQGRKQLTRTFFYVVGGGWVSWQQDETNQLDLVPDKEVYDVGEMARILVKNPYPEADALLTIEREGVSSARWLRLSGSSPTLEIPLEEALVPNVFVGLVLVRGRVPAEQAGTANQQSEGPDPGHPLVRMGYAQLRIEKKSKRLAVRVQPDAEQKRPRDRVRLDLQVSDAQGKGQRAEVTVWAVDEGVLRLTDYQVPDPVEAVHPLRGLSVRIGEPLLHLVLERAFGEKGRNAGGSGGAEAQGAGLRSKFGTTVLFTSVVTDARGAARTELELPDNLTTFRIMAVAATAGDRFGSGQSRVVVSKPLLALPALSRFARVGDRLEAGVVVHTSTAASEEVKVRAEVQGLVLEGTAEQQVTLTPGGRPREVRFALRAEQPGTATLRFWAEGGGERDGVEQKIPVQLPVVQEAVATYGETDGRRSEGIVPPQGIRPGVGGLELTLASTVLGGFDEGMRQLVEYPYGCLEQLSSRLVPFVALRELQQKLGVPFTGGSPQEERQQAQGDLISRWLGLQTLSLQDTRDPDEIVRRTVRAIEGLQQPDGGFAFWPSSSCSADFGSAYAVLALARSRDAGYPVSSEVLGRAQRFIAETVAAGRCIDCGWGCAPPRDATRAFALYALSRAGQPRPSYYPELFARREAMPLFARALLADLLLAGGGDAAQGREALAEV